MSYSPPAQNNVVFTWQGDSPYTLLTNTFSVYFADFTTGTITGKTRPNTKVVAIKRSSEGFDLETLQETVSDSNGDFSFTVPVDIAQYSVISVSDNGVRNSLIYDWISPQ